jgi:MFS transporter, putative metabolite:H+ symporter
METNQTAAELAARLQRLPTTRSSWLLVILAAGALVVEALDIGSLGVILPGVRALWHLSPSQVGTLAAASALGIAVGMIPAGRLADRFGRKRLLVAGVVWFCGGTMLSAAAPNYTTLVMIRGLSGLGMAPAFIMPYSIVSEFVSATTRSAFSGLLETALGVGYLLPPVLGILVIPHFSADVGWRVFLIIAGLPVIYVGVIIHYLPESPRWLSRIGRHDEAESVVRALEQRAEATLGRPLPPPEIAPEVTLAVSAHRATSNLAALRAVWSPPYLRRTVAMICGAFGTFSMFYVGVNYIPTLFVARHLAFTNALLFALVTTVVQIPGKILNGLTAELVGRKAIYAIYVVPAAVGAFMFGQATDPYAMLGWASLFLFCAAGSAPSYKMWYAEQYPTPIRATGQATVEAIGGRLIGGVIWTMLFPVIVAGWGIGVTMTALAIGAVTTCLIVVVFAPETRGRSVESLEAEVAAKATQNVTIGGESTRLA